MSFKRKLALALVACALVGCNIIDQHFANSFIHVKVTNGGSGSGMSDGVTKGSIVTTSSLGTADGFVTFGMEGFILDDVSGLDPQPETHYINGGTCSKSSDSWILTNGSSEEYKWIGSTNFAFWAYAPMSLFTPASFTKDGYSLTGYTIPSTVTSQKDLLVAYTKMNSGNGDAPVNITFKHALAAVRFKTNLVDCTLKSAGVSGVHATGDLTVGVKDGDVSFSWGNLSSSTTSFTQDFSSDDFDDAGVQDKTGNKLFFMIPQKNAPGTKAQISITVENADHETLTVTKELDIDWDLGKIYTYILTYDPEIQDVCIQVRGQKFESLDLDEIQWATDF